MQLNRTVCLDMPEAKVVWFHSGYCQKLLEVGKYTCHKPDYVIDLHGT